MKGEALAIRAFMHFDVLRLFGPTPAAVVSGRTNFALCYRSFNNP